MGQRGECFIPDQLLMGPAVTKGGGSEQGDNMRAREIGDFEWP